MVWSAFGFLPYYSIAHEEAIHVCNPLWTNLSQCVAGPNGRSLKPSFALRNLVATAPALGEAGVRPCLSDRLGDG
jgi:hypothetical protein